MTQNLSSISFSNRHDEHALVIVGDTCTGTGTDSIFWPQSPQNLASVSFSNRHAEQTLVAAGPSFREVTSPHDPHNLAPGSFSN